MKFRKAVSIMLAMALITSSFSSALATTTTIEKDEPQSNTNATPQVTQEENAETPTNPDIDDVFNTFGWTAVGDNIDYTYYEYSVDGGKNWDNCTANPQPLGNVALDVGQVCVRLRSLTEEALYPSLKNDVAFTVSDDKFYFFEDDAELKRSNTRSGKATLSSDVSISGTKSLKLEGVFNGKSAYTHNYSLLMDQVFTDKYVSMKFYITGSDKDALLIMPNNTIGNYQTGVGISLDEYKNFNFRIGAKTKKIKTATPGWHTIEWDYSKQDELTVFLDGEQVGHTTTAQAGINVDSFQYILFLNSWATKPNTHYFDDIVVSDSKSTKIDIEKAPTNPVNDDVNNTFAWRNVEGYDNANQYEYSIDGGATFETSTSNPQPVGNRNIDIGMLMVRTKKANTPFAGAVLKNDVAFTDSFTEEFSVLMDLREYASGFFKADYSDATAWANFEKALAEANSISIESSNDEIMSASTNLKSSVEALKNCFDLKSNLRYDYEANEELENPFTAVYGVLTKGEGISLHGKDIYSHYLDKKGAELTSEVVDGKHLAYAHYTFPVAIEDHIVDYSWHASALRTDEIDFVLLDESGENGFGLRSTPGNQTHYQFLTIKDGVETTVGTGIRRLNNGNHQLTWDFANPETGAKFYIDGRYLGSFDMDSFSQMVMRGETSADNFADEEQMTAFDKLLIREKNPATSVAIADEEAKVGYYDSYNLAEILLDIKGEDASYPSTDLLTYEVIEGKDVAQVTTSGVVEPMNFGEAVVKVTTTSGSSDTIKIISEDRVSTDVFITNSPAYDIVAMGAPGQDKNNSIPVEKTSEVVLAVGESQVLNPVISPVGTTERHVEWVSSDENVFVVRDGLVTAVNNGEATLTIKTKDGSNLTDTCKIIVKGDDHKYGKEIFVAPNGSDITGDGSIGKPYATIEKAKNVIASEDLPDGGVAVYFRAGNYPIKNTIEFTQENSGTQDKPIKYSAYKDEVVVFDGAVSIPVTDMELLTADEDMYNRVHASAKDKIYKVNVTELGVILKDLQMTGHSAGGLSKHDCFNGLNNSNPYHSVILNNVPMTLARFPNENSGDNGFTGKVTKYVEKGNYARGWEPDAIAAGWGSPYVEGLEDDTFSFYINQIPTSQLEKWKASIDPDTSVENAGGHGAWMLGYWGSSFSDQTTQIQSIDGNVIKSALISYYEVAENKSKFFAYNIFEELDIPGEWYIDELTDENNLMLYFYPPTGTDMTDDSNVISIPVLDETMIEINDASYITFDGIDMINMNSNTVSITGGDYNVIKNAKIENVSGRVGSVNSGKDGDVAKFNGFNMCEIKNINSGISLNAGDDKTLERGYNYVKNTNITNFSTISKSYNPAVGLGGVGNIVSNCILTDAPHNGMSFNGPESLIEFVEIYDVLKNTGDQACIYTGRDTLNRGSIIRNSYFHDVAHGSVENSGVYLDDGKGGVAIWDNVFENTAWGLKSSGGRNVEVIGNTFINLQKGYVTTPVGFVGPGSWYAHGLGLICNASNYDALCSVDWKDQDGPYGRFDMLWATMIDEPLKSKYSKTIDNTFINVDETKNPTDLDKANGFNIWCKNWVLQPYDILMSYIYDWMWTKNNIGKDGEAYSNPQEGSSQNSPLIDTSYDTRYSFETVVGTGSGEAYGDYTGVAKGITKKAVATPATGYEFVNWTNAKGEIVSENPIYTVAMYENQKLTANFAEASEPDTYTTVEFVSGYENKVVEVEVKNNVITDEEMPKAFEKLGYTVSWNMTAEQISNALANGETVEVSAVYVEKVETFNVTINGGTGSGDYKATDRIVVKADTAEDGKKFSHWTDAEGEVYGYYPEFTMLISKAVELTAVYVDDAEKVEEKATTTISNTIKTEKGVQFVSEHSVPMGCKIVEAGVIVAIGHVDDLTIDNCKLKSLGKTDSEIYRYTLSVNTTKQLTAVSYLQYTDANGETQTIYGRELVKFN